MAIIYGLKVNLSVAMVAMLNNTAIKAAGADHTTTLSTGGQVELGEPECQGSNTTETIEVIEAKLNCGTVVN